jgi:hypothetical protein
MVYCRLDNMLQFPCVAKGLFQQLKGVLYCKLDNMLQIPCVAKGLFQQLKGVQVHMDFGFCHVKED